MVRSDTTKTVEIELKSTMDLRVHTEKNTRHALVSYIYFYAKNVRYRD